MKKTAHSKKNKRSEGARRKTAQRKTRKASSWTKKVTDLYYKMKKADKSVEFKDALKRASELKKKGQL
jgi:hypothetical protein